ncbi:MAG TPA: hypothetical protein IAC46_04140 [Candidatus Onthoplasma faecigallinarum]|nr:hypothetical protein [Candidatus Onthoplasma faecigallinarum]
MLELVEAALEGRLKNEYKSIKINNREITKHSFSELTELRTYYRAEVARDKVRKSRKFDIIGFKF